MRKDVSFALGLSIFLWGCGEDGPSSPTSSSFPPDPSFPAGTVLTIVSGETEEAVPGATATVAGISYTSDAGGRVVLTERVRLGRLMDVVAPNYLDRQTLLRSASETRFTLWPKSSPTGLNENISVGVVYTPSACPFNEERLAAGGLRRLPPSASEVSIVLAPEIASARPSLASHEEAVARMNTGLGGRVVYRLATSRPDGGISFDARIDEADAGCGETTRAFVRLRTSSAGEITGGTIVYCYSEPARNAITIAHELGHTFGLQHSPDRSDLMFCYFGLRSQRFSPREILVMSLMMQRRARNRYPDNDRSATGLAAIGRIETISCS